MTRLPLALLPLVLLAGCGTQPAQVAPSALAAQKPGHGILFGTYSRADPKEKFDTESVEFRRRTGGRIYSVGINPLPLVPLKFDFQDEMSAGMLFVFDLPEGDYEINGFAVVDSTWGGQVTYYPRTKFSIPFTVKAGTVNYLGEILMDRIHGPSVLGIRSAESVHYDISNRLKRDSELFRKKYPDVAFPVQSVVPPSSAANPYFRIIEEGADKAVDPTPVSAPRKLERSSEG